jgi:hypothetical protein
MDYNLTDDLKAGIMKEIAPMIAGAGAALLVGAVSAAVMTLMSTNCETKTPAGDTERHPVKDENNASAVKTAGADTAGALTHEETNANTSAINAANNDANASRANTNAGTTQAQALETNAGASNISSEGMHITEKDRETG